MAVAEFHYQSPPLARQTALTVILPDEMPAGPLPVIYQLHGLSDSHSTWQRRTAIERHVQRHRCLVVCPDGGRGWYSNAQTAYGQYEDHILDCIRFIDRTFRTIDAAGGRAIGGLSMGGYGAMKLGLKYPQLFGSIAAHSGAMDIARDAADRWPEFPLIFPDGVPATDDCFHLAEQATTKPQIRFDCGVDDFLIEHNRALHAHFDQLGIVHEYEEFGGAHSWDYWDRHVPAALAFHQRLFDRLPT